MGLQVILFLLYTVIIIWIFSFIFLFKEKISCMAGMMAAMTVGMVLGLSFGTISALIYPNYFFEVTVISILFGALMGTIAGFPISIMAVLDGFLSGAMGGMMGAMLGMMVSGEAVNNAMNVIIIIAGGALFILFLMMQSEISIKDKGWKDFFYARCLPLFVAIVLAFYFTHQFSFPIKHGDFDHSLQPENNKSEKAHQLPWDYYKGATY